MSIQTCKVCGVTGDDNWNNWCACGEREAEIESLREQLSEAAERVSQLEKSVADTLKRENYHSEKHEGFRESFLKQVDENARLAERAVAAERIAEDRYQLICGYQKENEQQDAEMLRLRELLSAIQEYAEENNDENCDPTLIASTVASMARESRQDSYSINPAIRQKSNSETEQSQQVSISPAGTGGDPDANGYQGGTPGSIPGEAGVSGVEPAQGNAVGGAATPGAADGRVSVGSGHPSTQSEHVTHQRLENLQKRVRIVIENIEDCSCDLEDGKGHDDVTCLASIDLRDALKDSGCANDQR